MIGDRTRTIVIGVVTGVWFLNFAAGLVPALNYQPDQAINGIFMAIVGGLFALGAAKKDGGSGGGGSGGGNAAPPTALPPPVESNSPEGGGSP